MGIASFYPRMRSSMGIFIPVSIGLTHGMMNMDVMESAICLAIADVVT